MHGDYLDGNGFGLGSGKDRPDDALHSRLQLGFRHDFHLAGLGPHRRYLCRVQHGRKARKAHQVGDGGDLGRDRINDVQVAGDAAGDDELAEPT